MEFSANILENDSKLAKENERLARYYAAIARNRQCSRCQGILMTLNFMDINFESLDSPVMGPDGAVSHIIGIIDTDPSNLIQDSDIFL